LQRPARHSPSAAGSRSRKMPTRSAPIGKSGAASFMPPTSRSDRIGTFSRLALPRAPSVGSPLPMRSVQSGEQREEKLRAARSWKVKNKGWGLAHEIAAKLARRRVSISIRPRELHQQSAPHLRCHGDRHPGESPFSRVARRLGRRGPFARPIFAKTV